MRPLLAVWFVILVVSPASGIAENGWTQVSDTGDTSIWIRNGSAELHPLGEDTVSVSAVVRTSAGGEISLAKAHVSSDDCANEYGSMLFNNFDGETTATYDFASGAGRAADVLGEMLCLVMHRMLLEFTAELDAETGHKSKTEYPDH